ncbi:MAG: flagellar M-ring protein FliF [Bdellovibrionales bacterium]|nr:flagellar M-ring protein FliF [Bdellovibrionales bacterium]
MEKVIGNIIAQFRDFFKSLPPIKRNSIIMATTISVVGVIIVAVMLSRTNYKPLFKNVKPDQLGLVVNNLKQKNISFTLEDDGKTILVPGDLLHATQMAIMSEVGDQNIGDVGGLEIFKENQVGMTKFAQRVNFQRALQGELMRSINSLAVVKESKVILALPQKKTFLEEGGAPKASVVVNLYPGKQLSPDQVRGIVHLVAASVPDMDRDDVTVVDVMGKVLSKKYGGEGGASDFLVELKKRTEVDMESRVEAILKKVVGVGNVIAKVNVTLDPNSVSSVEEIVDPDKTAIRSSVTEEEMLDGARTNPSGVPGARANLPGAADQGEVGFKQNVRKELKTTNFAVPKTTKKVIQAPGAIRKITVAVLVDGKTEIESAVDGKTTEKWTPRTPEELQRYETLVSNTLGIDATRGDSVKIENMQFKKEDFTEAEEILTLIERKKLIHALFKWSLLGLSLALMYFVVVRPFMRWITDSFQDTVEDMLPRTIEELEELQAVDNSLPGMSGALPVLEESIDPDKAESELLKERIMAVLEQHEDKAAGAFNLWVMRREL